MADRTTSWDSAMARSSQEQAERSQHLILQKTVLVLGWHLALWIVVLIGIAVSLTVERRGGVGVATWVVAAYSFLSTVPALLLLKRGRSGTGVVSALLALDGLVLVAALTIFVPDAPVALGVAVLPVVGLAVVGGARLALTLAILQNGLMLSIWLNEAGVWLTELLGVTPAGLASPLDVAAFAALTTTAALLATVAARSGFAGVGVLRDELAFHTRHLAAANALLTAQNEALEAFNTAVGHDLRNPLTTARLAVGIVREECETEDQAECIDDAIEAIERLTTMVEELLKVARSGGAVELNEVIGLNSVVDDALANLSVHVQQTNAQIRVVGDLPTIEGNRTILAEAVQNLVENALKYGGKPIPHIRITGGWVGSLAFLEVEDDGPGVPTDARERVFMAFEQLDSRTHGVGAGLSLVRRLVEAHGGRISVDDGRYLGGACFRICLPTSESPEQAMAAR
jgi:signal transduction histidine kinase